MVKSGHLSAVWLLLGLAPPCAADDATRQQALQIASAAYTANVATLSADQQQAMIAITNGVSAKLGSDPVGHLSGAFVGMLTQGAKPQAAAAMAAWAVKQQPDSAALLNNFGYALFQLKDYPHAVTILAQSLALNGHCAECATNLGNAYLDNNQDELAKSTFQAALKIDPDHDLAWMGLADYYMKTHQVKAAVDILARRHGTGFIQKGQDKAQAALNAVSESDKCDWVLEDDSPDAACEKVAKIAKIQPVSLGPIVETMSPALAQQIAAALTRPPVKLKAPVDPSMLDYSSSEAYYVTTSAYRDVVPLPRMAPPPLTPAQQRLKDMSEEERHAVGEQLRRDAEKAAAQIKGMKIDPSNPASIQAALKVIKAIPDPYGLMPTAGSGAAAGAQAPGPAGPAPAAAAFPGKDTPGLVTTTNFDNHLRNKLNFLRARTALVKQFRDYCETSRKAFDEEMAALKATQAGESSAGIGDSGLATRQIHQRNALRDNYLSRFNTYYQVFYRKYVSPLVADMDNTSALYVKSISDPTLKQSEAHSMRALVDDMLNSFANAQAPVDPFEPDGAEHQKLLERRIAIIKAQAPHGGEPMPKMAQYDQDRKTLLDWLYKDAKFSVAISSAKIEFKNNTLTVAASDLMSQEYMQLDWNPVDQTVALTTAKGSEFNVAVGMSNADGSKTGVGAGYSELSPGTTTTLHYNDDLQVDDAKVTTFKGTDSVTGSVSIGNENLGVKGSATTSLAEGLSGIHTAVQTSYEQSMVSAQATLSDQSVGLQAGLGGKGKTDYGDATGKAMGGLSVDANGNVYSEATLSATFDAQIKNPDTKDAVKMRGTLFANNYKKQIQ